MTYSKQEVAKTEEVNLSQKLYESEKGIIMASKSEKVVDLTNTPEGREKITHSLIKWLNVAGDVAGFKQYVNADAQKQNSILQYIYDVIISHKWLRVKELAYIFDKGLKGEFDDENNKSFELNARTVNRWINTYHDSKRREAIRKQQEHESKLEQAKQQERSEQKNQEAWERNRKKIIDQYYALKDELKDKIEAGEVSYKDVPDNMNELNFWYDIFNKKEYIPLTVEDKKKVYNQFKENAIRKPMDDDAMHDQRIKSKCKMYSFKVFIAMLLANNDKIENYIDN